MTSQPCVALAKSRGISYYTGATTTTSPPCKYLKKCLKPLPVCVWRLKEVSVQCRGKFKRRRCFNFQEAQEEEKKRKTTRGNMKERNRRRSRNMEEEDEESNCFDLMAQMGMPLLYIIGLLTGIVGVICQGVITGYWSNPSSGVGSCFLYAKTASSQVVYQFGSAVAVCEWVTYGAVVAIIIAFISGLVYIIMVRQHKELTYSSALSVAGILVATLLMLAVTCTMAEGMRITCASMGLNAANNKGGSCYEKLDQRASHLDLPVQTSTLVRSALITLVCSTVAFFTICCFHLSDFYRRTLRHRYSDVPYQDRG